MALMVADDNLSSLHGPSATKEAIAELTTIREHVQNAHDVVGVSNIHSAILELNNVIEIKMGL